MDYTIDFNLQSQYPYAIIYNGEGKKVMEISRQYFGSGIAEYKFFERNGRIWLVLWQPLTIPSIIIYDIENKDSYYDWNLRGGYYKIIPNPSGDYLFVIDNCMDFGFYSMQDAFQVNNRLNMKYMSIEDSTDRYYDGEGDIYVIDESRDYVEWIDEKRLLLRTHQNYLCFDIKDKNVELNWIDTSLHLLIFYHIKNFENL